MVVLVRLGADDGARCAKSVPNIVLGSAPGSMGPVVGCTGGGSGAGVGGGGSMGSSDGSSGGPARTALLNAVVLVASSKCLCQ